MQFPKLLVEGDTLRIVCPSAFMPKKDTDACVEICIQKGFVVELGNTLNDHSDNYFSGTDAERLSDLQKALDNPHIKAILMGRGGYGLSRIIDKINWKKFLEYPKWICGFSDITLLHIYLQNNLGFASLHSPMTRAFQTYERDKPYLITFFKALMYSDYQYIIPTHKRNRRGTAEGILIGGNLTLLAHSVGTMPLNFTDTILFIEDVGEYLYNIDRMLWQLKRAGLLDNLRGVIVGSFTELKDTQRPFGTDIDGIIEAIFADYSYPVCFGFPAGHQNENYTLKLGHKHRLSVGDKEAYLETS